MALTKVTTGGIKDGTITNEDISTTTSISQDKLAAKPGASSTAHGLMRSSDKIKLDGIADNANNYSHPSAHTISEVTGLQGLLDGKTTETYVNTQITNVVGVAPAALDTLTELAAALGDDANFAGTVTNALAGKVDNSQVLTNVPAGALFTDTNTTYSVGDGGLSEINFTSADHSKLNGIATSANNYSHPTNHAISVITGLQTALDSKLPLAGGTMTGALTVPEIAVSGTVDGVDISSIPSDITGISYQSANINVFPNQNLDLTGAGAGYKGNYSGMANWALNSNHAWDFQVLFTSPNAVTAANRTQEDRDLWEDGFGRGAPTHYAPTGLKVIRVSVKKLNANNNWTMFPNTLAFSSSAPWTVSCLHRYVSGAVFSGAGWKTGETTGTWQRNVLYHTTAAAGGYSHLHPSWSGATGLEAVFDLCTFVVLSGKVPPERIGHHAMHPYSSGPWVY